MINYIIINGTNSNTINGLGINELPPISKPPLRVQTEEIDGRDGDISTNLGYGAYDKTISIGLFGTGYDINEVISFFNGEGTVVFSNEPNKYYKYKIINQIDYEALLKFKSATITFHCQPFKYPLTETPLEIEYEYIEQEGVESATMNNTNGGTSLKINLKGNTSQDTTTGKNLFDYSKVSSVTNYLTLNNDVFTYANGAINSSYVYFNSMALQANTTYSFDVFLVGATQNTKKVIIVLRNTNGDELARIDKKFDTNISLQYTPSSDVNIDRLQFYNVPENPMDGAINFKIQIEKSEAMTDYEPYTNGASPNPDYPQVIHTITGDNEVVVCGKNLFDIKNYSKSGWIMTIDNPLKNMSAGNYTISCQNKYITASKGVRIYFSNTISGVEIGNVFTDYNFGNTIMSETKSLTQEQLNANYMILYPNDNQGTQQVLEDMKIMIESGNSVSTYEPYNGDTYELDLGVENLLNPSNLEQGWINTSGEESSYSNRTRFDDYVNVESSTSYYLSSLGITSSENWWVHFYDENKQWLSYYSASDMTSHNNIFTTPNNCKYVRGAIAVQDTTISNGILAKSNKPTSYTPYGTTPIKMRGIGTYEDYFVRNSGKNLLNIPDGTYGSGDFTITAKNGVLTPSFSTIPSTKSFVINTNITLEAGTYTFNSSLAQAYPYFNLKSGDTVIAVNTYSSQGKVTFTLDETTTIDNIYIYYGGTSFTYGVMTPQIEVGSEATIVEPYGTGQWCKYNAIGKVVLNGSENWQYEDISNFRNYLITLTDVIGNDTSPMWFCNYFNSVSGNSAYNGNNVQNAIGIGTSKKLRIRNTSFETTSDFKTWLSTHNTIVYYVLATPYLSLIEDETLISQLDNIENAMSYEGTTNISQVNNDKPFLLDLIAMEKGTDEVVINNIGNVYAKPTIALEGTGETDIYLNNTEILKVDLSEKNKITIDTNNMEAYDPTDNSLANRKVIGNYNSMTLPSGNTTMKITGALTKATITDYTRWL